MSSRIITRLAPGLIMGVLAATALGGHRALAQAALPQPTSMGPVVQGGNGNQQAQPSAAGLPGARGAAPVKQSAIDASLLSPNDELFDAINRGDINTARDAIARGADLGATDAVGQTPIDLSVSLARNNITFLLVTLLHAGGGTEITDAQGPMAQPPANTLGLSSKDQKAVSTPVGFFSGSATAAAKKRRQKYGESAEVASAPAAPSYSGGTGSADPQAGFVGFGSTAQ